MMLIIKQPSYPKRKVQLVSDIGQYNEIVKFNIYHESNESNKGTIYSVAMRVPRRGDRNLRAANIYILLRSAINPRFDSDIDTMNSIQLSITHFRSGPKWISDNLTTVEYVMRKT